MAARASGFVVAFVLLLGMAQVASAGTPAPGSTITQDVTFDSDLDATGHTGYVLTIGADDVTIDGKDPVTGEIHLIHAPNAYLAIYSGGYSRITIKNLRIFQGPTTTASITILNGSEIRIENCSFEDGSSSSIGIRVMDSNGAAVVGCDVSAMGLGISISGTDDVLVQDSDCSSCPNDGIRISTGRDHDVIDNDLSGSRVWFDEVVDLTLRETKGRDFGNAGEIGLYLTGVSGSAPGECVVEGIHLSANNLGAYLIGCSGLEMRNCDFSDSATGVFVSTGTDLLFEDNSCANCSSRGMQLGYWDGPSAGFTIRRNDVSGTGIGLIDVASVSIAPDNVFGSGAGLSTFLCPGLVLDGLQIHADGRQFGIRAEDCTDLSVRNCFVEGAQHAVYGVRLERAEILDGVFEGSVVTHPTVSLRGNHILVRGNTVTGGRIEVGYFADDPGLGNRVIDNDLGPGTGIRMINQTDVTVRETRDTVYSDVKITLKDVTGGTVEGFRISDAHQGVWAGRCESVTFRDMFFTGCQTALSVHSESHDCVIEDNRCEDCSYGITVGRTDQPSGTNERNVIRRNTTLDCRFGLSMAFNVDTVVESSNVFHECTHTGVYLTESSGFSLDGLVLRGGVGGEVGLRVYGCTGIEVVNCAISHWPIGLVVQDGAGVVIHHNEFLSNTTHAHDSDPSATDWHDPVAQEGNYWDDYTGVDEDDDGIGDTLVPHPGPGFDMYPFTDRLNPSASPTIELLMGGEPIDLTGDPFEWVTLKELVLTVRATDANSEDTLTLTGSVPNGAALDPALPQSGYPVETVLTWTPVQADDGTHTLTFTADDGTGNQTTVTLDVTAVHDSDGDGLPDHWETAGYWHEGVYVNLPALGAVVGVKDVFVEIDWVEGQRPLDNALSLVEQSFAAAPEPIQLHVVLSDELTFAEFPGLLDGLGQNPDREPFDWTGTDEEPSEYALIKSARFTPGYSAAFHYCIFCDTLGSDGVRSGLSRDAPASDFIVALGGFPDAVPFLDALAGTFLHELGHNLGLDHGGPVEVAGELSYINRKPNYLSVMNYLFQFGLVREGYDYGDRELYDLSRLALPPLDETSMLEADGLTGGAYIAEVAGFGTKWHWGGVAVLWPDPTKDVNDPIDWDGKAGTETVGGDVNKDPYPIYRPFPPPPGWDYPDGPLQSYEDWPHLVFDGGQIGAAGVRIPLPRYSTIKCITLEEARVLFPAPPGPQTPPVPDAATSTGQTEYSAEGPEGAEVTLTAEGSTDPDGDPLTYWWYEDGVRLGSGPTLTLVFAPGEHRVHLFAEDRRYRAGPAEVFFLVTHDAAPVIEEVSADPSALWPPNNMMVEVTVTVVAWDDHDPSPSSRIVGVTCDEECEGDVAITGALTVDLRAERDGSGDGRVYKIEVECTDSYGNVSVGLVEVTVPHDQGVAEAASAPTVTEPTPAAVEEPKVAPEGGSTTTPQVVPEGSNPTESSGSSGGEMPTEPGTLNGGSGLADPPSDPTEEEDEFGTEPVDPKKASGELETKGL